MCMKNPELDSVIEKLQYGKISKKQAVNRICTFVSNNYPVFGLHRYDEDFRSDLILTFLERGERVLDLYNPQAGDFFSFLYCYITMMTNSKRKTIAKKAISESCAMEELQYSVQEKQLSYAKLTYASETPKVPYAPNKVSAEELRSTLLSLSNCKEDKKLLVIALKSSFYITEPQIDFVCRYYKIQKPAFYEILERCNRSISVKVLRRKKALERRNSAYYQHKRYKKLIERITGEEDEIAKEIKMTQLSEKERKYQRMWNNLNISFRKGYLYLRPTNKTVANILGICERQVSYYLTCAKKDSIKKESEKKENQNLQNSMV